MRNSSIFFTEIDGKYVLPVPRSGFTINDENSEFSDDILVEWTYPYNIYQTDLIKRIFPDYLNPNAKKRKQDRGYINVDGVVSPCILKFLGGQSKELKVQFEFGVGVLTIMDKNLSEIDFGVLETEGLYDYIDSNIGKTYPESDICFPRVINYKYFENFLSENEYYGGRGVFNDSNLIDGEAAARVLRNQFDEDDFAQLIFNRIKPIPYLLFILRRSFQIVGLDLKGDIVDDDYIQQITVDHNNVADQQYGFEPRKMEIKNNGVDIINYEKVERFEIAGVYIVSLETTNNLPDNALIEVSVFDVTNNVLLFSWSRLGGEGYPLYPTYELTHELPYFESPILVDYKIKINNISYYLTAGEALTAFLNPKGDKYYYLPKILDINKFMPDCTFKELFNMVLKLRNYGVTITSKNEIFLDFVNNEPPNQFLNLEFSEQADVEILPNDRSDYILTYSAPEELGFADYLVKDRALLEVKKGDYPEATLIDLAAYPLQDREIAVVGGVKLEEPESELKGVALFRFVGLYEGYNNGIKIPDMMQSIYARSDNYIENRLTCDLMKWSFTTTRRLSDLRSQMPVYAYGCFHKIKNIIKTYYESNLTKYDIETENRY